jgi:lantibiotic biosynthesis dehydratase-like protein
MEEHLVPLTHEWSLWRDFAVRSAGFPVSGLDVFGPGDESAKLAEVASDPAFQEAVVWQNRSAYRTAVASIAREPTASGSKRRRREDVVAAYWQRYCSKNDSIGFFGPLAWGQIRADGPAVAFRSGSLIAAREVHFETWAVEALAQRMEPGLVVPLQPWSEVDLRRQLEQRGENRSLDLLDRLEAARDAVAGASGVEDLVRYLDQFDATFEELTGQTPAPGEDSSGGGRTPLYLDCMRDLDLELGPAIVAELARAMPVLLEASRWWNARYFARSCEILQKALEHGLGEGRFEPLFDHLCDALWELPSLLIPDMAAMQDRMATVLAAGDEAAAAARRAFADHGDSFPMSVFHSVDLQIAASSVGAIDAGDFMCVAGDFHSGNPLSQGMFVDRFPDPDQMRAMFHADAGSPLVGLVMLRNPRVPVSSRMSLRITDQSDVHLVGPRLSTPGIDRRSHSVSELLVHDGHVFDREGTVRIPLTHLLFLPMYIAAGVRTFRPFPEGGHRITVGRTVLRRATWTIPAADCPADPAAIAGWANAKGLPRRVFVRCPEDPKPTYIDFQSASLARILRRTLAHAIDLDPKALATFSEMLPGPDQCWLEQDGDRYTSELRLVFVDRDRRGAGTLPPPK